MDAREYEYRFIARQMPVDPKSWKERAAWFLRRLADRLDRLESLAIHFESTPKISRDYRNRCVEAGMNIAKSLLVEAVEYECMDQLLKESNPDLWGATASKGEKP